MSTLDRDKAKAVFRQRYIEHTTVDQALDYLERCILPDPRIDAVRALHFVVRDAPMVADWCSADGGTWPCATIRALDGTS